MNKTTRHFRQLLGAAAFLAGLAALGAASMPSAEAQQNGRAVKPKGKPGKPAAPVAATAAPPAASSAVAPVASVAGSTGPVPAPLSLAGDGGVKASPLNPTAEEMPGYVAPGSSAAAPVPTVDYDKLLGDIAALRARVADVSDALFVSRIVLSLEADGDHAKIGT